MARLRGDHETADLLGWAPPAVTVGFSEDQLRGGAVRSRIARAIGIALRCCDKDRETIAKEMSDALGERVSRAMLDAYASEARTEHRITLERFIALIQVTGCLELLGFVSEQFDHAVVPKKYAPIVELYLLEEHEREVAARKSALNASLRRLK